MIDKLIRFFDNFNGIVGTISSFITVYIWIKYVYREISSIIKQYGKIVIFISIIPIAILYFSIYIFIISSIDIYSLQPNKEQDEMLFYLCIFTLASILIIKMICQIFHLRKAISYTFYYIAIIITSIGLDKICNNPEYCIQEFNNKTYNYPLLIASFSLLMTLCIWFPLAMDDFRINNTDSE